jgi:hypothetical protein
MKIVVAGCVAQQEGQQLLRRVPELDLVMGESPTAGQGVARWASQLCVLSQLTAGPLGAEHRGVCNDVDVWARHLLLQGTGLTQVTAHCVAGSS